MNTRTDDGMTNGAGNVIKLIQTHHINRTYGIEHLLKPFIGHKVTRRQGLLSTLILEEQFLIYIMWDLK